MLCTHTWLALFFFTFTHSRCPGLGRSGLWRLLYMTPFACIDVSPLPFSSNIGLDHVSTTLVVDRLSRLTSSMPVLTCATFAFFLFFPFFFWFAFHLAGIPSSPPFVFGASLCFPSSSPIRMTQCNQSFFSSIPSTGVLCWKSTTGQLRLLKTSFT